MCGCGIDPFQECTAVEARLTHVISGLADTTEHRLVERCPIDDLQQTVDENIEITHAANDRFFLRP